MKIYIFGLLLAMMGLLSHAEPWLSNRFAQNCAGCHAPGRMNRPPEGRRCTLSCQGCHVSPQGGGMRNQYGMWTGQRWMRSFISHATKDKKTPAPLDRQPYHNVVKALATKYGGGGAGASAAKGQGSMLAQAVGQRPQMAVIGVTHPPESRYTKKSYSDWLINVESDADYQSLIPRDDPYWREREIPVYASGDLRYFYGSLESTTKVASNAPTTATTDLDLLMAFDLGARVRPVRAHQLSFVGETRVFNSPATTSGLQESLTENSAKLRSGYLLVDDLMYNSFFQYGVYRPMFGQHNPNHASMMNVISGLDQNSTFNAVGFGTAPNVPFFNFNLIQAAKDGTIGNASSNTSLGRSDSGYVATFGGRFVTMGASVALSYWNTSYEATNGNIAERTMYSLTGGLSLLESSLILNMELLNFERSLEDGSNHKGMAYSFDAKYRWFRENYLTFGMVNGNTSVLSTKGSLEEMSFGLKSFLISGTELELLYVNQATDVDDSDTTIEASGFLVQAHLFF